MIRRSISLVLMCTAASVLLIGLVGCGTPDAQKNAGGTATAASTVPTPAAGLSAHSDEATATGKLPAGYPSDLVPVYRGTLVTASAEATLGQMAYTVVVKTKDNTATVTAFYGKVAAAKWDPQKTFELPTMSVVAGEADGKVLMAKVTPGTPSGADVVLYVGPKPK